MSGLTSFSFANVSVVIDGAKLEGFWEGDDPVTVERNAEAGNPIVGVDGCAVVSRPVNDSRNITLMVMPNSLAHRILTNKMRAIENNEIEIFAISVTDVGNGEGGSSVEATIVQQPSMSFGENAGSREWTIFANNWTDNEVQYTL